MPQRYIKKILDARVYDVAIETPLTEARSLSKRFGNNILLKREDLQPVFSFKIRGAYNRIAQLSEEQKAKGVICASAGNHAQGVALAAKNLGIKAVIVMPQTTPEIKVRSVRDHGAKVVLRGDAFDEAAAHAQELIAKHGYTYIPPYDDPDVIAGQGTVAMEIMWQFSKPIHAIFICVGGGGLIAGMAAYIKYLRPEIKVIGVEPEDSNCLQAAMKAGKRVVLDEVGIFADGVAVKQIGKYPWEICKDHVDEVITVSTDEICAAIKDVFEDTRSIAEPAGALGVAGIKKYIEREKIENENLVATLSGANMNFDRLRYISERTEIGEKREAILAVTIPEKPGAFKTFINALHKRSITEFSYRGHRVVGTSEQFPEHFRYGRDQKPVLADGEWFVDVFDVVLGAQVARKHAHKTGDKIILSHGGGRTSFSNHKDTPFTVTGILAPTGTPVDQAVYVSLEGLEAIHIGWESGVAIPGRTVTAEEARQRDLTPDAITAAFVGIDRKVLTFQVQRQINESQLEPLSAVLPGVALSELWRIMGQFEKALLGITGFVVITSLVGLVAVLLTLQVQRRQEVAILRATGASPTLIALLHVIECVVLAVAACGLAIVAGAAGIAALSPWLLETWGVQVGLRPLNPTEWLIIASVPLASLLVGLIPALQAWRGSRKQGLGHAAPE